MMDKKLNKRFHLLCRAEFLIKLINNENVDALMSDLTAFQLKELRSFLENELLYLSSLNGNSLNRDRIKSKYPSIHDYYYSYDCREELDSCYNETCLLSNPNCFGRKMREQINVLKELLTPYLMPEEEQELEFENVVSLSNSD